MLLRFATAVEGSNLYPQNRDPRVGARTWLEHSEERLCACIPTFAASLLTCVTVYSLLPASEHHRKGQARSEDFIHTRPNGESTIFYELPDQAYGIDLFFFHPFAYPMPDYLSNVKLPTACNVYATKSISRQAGKANNGCYPG
jgi:hypothetical protein